MNYIYNQIRVLSSTDDMLLFLQMLSFFLALHNIFQVLSFEQVKVVLK